MATGGLFVFSVDDEQSRPIAHSDLYTVEEGRLSPDGRLLAYRSNKSGRDEVYVRPFPGPSGKWQLSIGGGAQSMWSGSGRELFYRSGDRMMVVELEGETSLAASAPRMLFEGSFPENTPGDPIRYDVTPNGERFFMVVSGTHDADADADAGQPEIHVVLNWTEELKQLVPTDN